MKVLGYTVRRYLALTFFKRRFYENVCVTSKYFFCCVACSSFIRVVFFKSTLWSVLFIYVDLSIYERFRTTAWTLSANQLGPVCSALTEPGYGLYCNYALTGLNYSLLERAPILVWYAVWTRLVRSNARLQWLLTSCYPHPHWQLPNVSQCHLKDWVNPWYGFQAFSNGAVRCDRFFEPVTSTIHLPYKSTIGRF